MLKKLALDLLLFALRTLIKPLPLSAELLLEFAISLKLALDQALFAPLMFSQLLFAELALDLAMPLKLATDIMLTALRMLTVDSKLLAMDLDLSLITMLSHSETSKPLLETLKDELLLLETSKLEMDGLLDTRPTRLQLITLLLMLFTLEEMLLLDLELFIPMDRTPLTQELKKEFSLEEALLDPITYQASLLDATESLLAQATSLLLSLLPDRATLDSPTRSLPTRITLMLLSNGLDFTWIATTRTLLTTTLPLLLLK